MMAPLPRLLVFALGLTVLLLVINLVRKRQLQERYAILWLLAGVALTLAPVFIPWLDHLAFSIGFEYPPALLLLLAVVGLLLIIFQLSLNISRNSEQIKILTQELGLLRCELEKLRRQQAMAGASLADLTIHEQSAPGAAALLEPIKGDHAADEGSIAPA